MAHPELSQYLHVTEAQARRFEEGVRNAGDFFMERAPVNLALEAVCADLERDGIPYAIAGAMALNLHGYRRVTVDVDILITAEGLAEFKRRHLGLGYVERFPGSKGLRNTEHNVAIDFLMSGEFPGDGKPKPIRFPDPSVAELVGGKRLLPTVWVINLKLASGLSAEHRQKDLVDVQELIKHASLPLELADELDPSVREEYARRWRLAQIALLDER